MENAMHADKQNRQLRCDDRRKSEEHAPENGFQSRIYYMLGLLLLPLLPCPLPFYDDNVTSILLFLLSSLEYAAVRAHANRNSISCVLCETMDPFESYRIVNVAVRLSRAGDFFLLFHIFQSWVGTSTKFT